MGDSTESAAVDAESNVIVVEKISRSLYEKIKAITAIFLSQRDETSMRVIRQHLERTLKLDLKNVRKELKEIATAINTDLDEKRKSSKKAMEFIEQLSQNPRHFQLFGLDIAHTMYDISRICNGWVGRKSLYFAKTCAMRWRHECAASLSTNSSRPSASLLIQQMLAIHSIERLGVAVPFRVQVTEHFRTQRQYSATNFLGWDPMNEAPPVRPTMSSFAHMTKALNYCYVASQHQIDLKCHYGNVFQWVRAMYPYKGPTQLDWTTYLDQCFMVFAIIRTISDYGALICEPEILPYEYEFLKQNIMVHISHGNTLLVAEFVIALRTFGVPNEDPTIKRACAFLLGRQMSSGGWYESEQRSSKTPLPPTEAFNNYRLSALCIRALMTPIHRGFFPSVPQIVPVLEFNYKEILTKKTMPDVPTEMAQDSRVPRLARSIQSLKDSSITKEISLDAQDALSEADAEVAMSVGMLQQAIDYHGDGDESRGTPTDVAKDLLRSLSNMNLSFHVLKKTGIGRTVGTLKKHHDIEVQRTAKELLATWKKMISE